MGDIMADIKEVVIVSGKGGTGKTTLAGALVNLIEDKIIADCDVDAANLHIIVTPEKVMTQKDFTGGKKASIDLKRCTQCNICRDICKYDAITKDYIVDKVLCEGCGACYFLCPARAVEFTPSLSGYCYTCSTTHKEIFVYAELLPGEENSGKLVATVRNMAREEAQKANKQLILIDGPPGIGCPVISSLTGTHLALIVTEPTPSGFHDLKRVVELAHHFQIKTAIVVNKGDINIKYVDDMKKYCYDNGIIYIGEIPYETKITEAQRNMKTILEFDPDCHASMAIKEIHKRLQSILEEI